MRNHDDCEDEIATAMRQGRDGWAEYLATRCDRQHRDETTDPTTAEEASA